MRADAWLSFLFISVAGCSGPPRDAGEAGAYTVLLPRDARDSATVMAARAARSAIDSQVHAAPEKMILVAGLANGTLAPVTGPGAWPDSTATSYDVFRDQPGQVRLAFESPFSQSGDWNLDATHYFDAQEVTFLVERQVRFFNGCWSDSTGVMVPIRETITSYLDATGRVVAREVTRTTFDDEPAPTKRCNPATQQPYRVYPSWNSLAAATGLARLLGNQAAR
jgi:hypothetical protein